MELSLYHSLICNFKNWFRKAQVKAIVVVNKELVGMY